MAQLAHVKPVYKTLPGWQSDTTGLTDFELLPDKAKEYLRFMADDLGVDICVVSTGARREETIMVGV